MPRHSNSSQPRKSRERATIPLEIYLWLAEAQKAIDAFLLSETANATAQERTNLRFYVAMVAAAKVAKTRVWAPPQLRPAAEAETPITDADLPACLNFVRERFAAFEETTGDSGDKIAKGQEFVEFVLDSAFPSTGASSV